jgi:catechol 2,3-dioxygenase-like lactoylglutathione lyase family enzyme
MKARTVPILPSADLDDSIAFYEALGFERTYRQRRPNPHAVVELGEIGIHLFELENFDPEGSYGSVIIVVSDPDGLYAGFAAGLRARFGKLPSSGIPRILRPRKKHGTVRGFSVVDPGGNWLRISLLGDEEGTQEETTGLARVIENAARIGDAKGDDREAVRLLRNGLDRFTEAHLSKGPGPSSTSRSSRSGLATNRLHMHHCPRRRRSSSPMTIVCRSVTTSPTRVR